MKRPIFFNVFLGMQIYEAIAAIFWQSASYVLNTVKVKRAESKETR